MPDNGGASRRWSYLQWVGAVVGAVVIGWLLAGGRPPSMLEVEFGLLLMGGAGLLGWFVHRWFNDVSWARDARIQKLEHRLRKTEGYLSAAIKKYDQLAAQEALFSLLINNVSDLIALHAPDGTYLYASPSHAELTGFTPRELKAFTPDDLASHIHPDDRQRVQDEVQAQTRKGEAIIRVQYRRLRKDGSYFWAESITRRVLDDEGQVRILSSVHDIDLRRRLEEYLYLNEVRSSQLLRAIPDHVFVVDGTGAVVDAKMGEEKILLPDSLVGIVMGDFLPLQVFEKTIRAVHKAQETGQVVIETTSWPTADKGLQTFENRFISLEHNRVMILTRNITERLKAEQALKQSNEALRDFAHVISHDLKAPMRGISMVANWLSTDYTDLLDDEGRELIRIMLNRVGRMESMIDGVLRYSRVGRLNEGRQPVDLNRMVREIADLFGSSGRVVVRIANPLPTLWVEPISLQQVFQNLIDNAVKFNDKAVCEVSVDVAPLPEGGWLFSVADNGPGIAPEYHERVFQLFHTLQTKEEANSAGVGLAIVKRMVDLSGGRVWVNSHLGAGSTFYFSLPERVA